MTAQTAKLGPHVWDKPLNSATFEKRVDEQIDVAKKSVEQLLAVKGPRTLENTLVPYDNAVEGAGYGCLPIEPDADRKS